MMWVVCWGRRMGLVDVWVSGVEGVLNDGDWGEMGIWN